LELKVLEIQRISLKNKVKVNNRRKKQKLEPKLKVFQENQVFDNIATYLNLFCSGAAVCKLLKASL
jgi:hypothetical protein